MNANKDQHKNCTAFTLLEVIVMTGILSILAMMAMNSFRGYVARAYISERKINLSGIITLIESHKGSEGTYPTNRKLLPDGTYELYTDEALTNDDYSSRTSCHKDNIFNFKLSNCQKARYLYAYLGPDPIWHPTYFSLYAIEGGFFKCASLNETTGELESLDIGCFGMKRRIFPRCQAFTVEFWMISPDLDGDPRNGMDPYNGDATKFGFDEVFQSCL